MSGGGRAFTQKRQRASNDGAGLDVVTDGASSSLSKRRVDKKRKFVELPQDEDTNDEADGGHDKEEERQPQLKRAARGSRTGVSTEGSPQKRDMANTRELRVSITGIDEGRATASRRCSICASYLCDGGRFTFTSHKQMKGRGWKAAFVASTSPYRAMASS